MTPAPYAQILLPGNVSIDHELLVLPPPLRPIRSREFRRRHIGIASGGMLGDGGSHWCPPDVTAVRHHTKTKLNAERRRVCNQGTYTKSSERAFASEAEIVSNVWVPLRDSFPPSPIYIPPGHD